MERVDASKQSIFISEGDIMTKKHEKDNIFNNIPRILKEKDISIRRMAIDLDIDYSTMHGLVNRNSLENTQLGRLVEISKYLNVDIKKLYENREE